MQNMNCKRSLKIVLNDKISQLIERHKNEERLSQIVTDFLHMQRVSGQIYDFTVYQVIERTGVNLVVDIQLQEDYEIDSFFYKI